MCKHDQFQCKDRDPLAPYFQLLYTFIDDPRIDGAQRVEVKDQTRIALLAISYSSLRQNFVERIAGKNCCLRTLIFEDGGSTNLKETKTGESQSEEWIDRSVQEWEQVHCTDQLW